MSDILQKGIPRFIKITAAVYGIVALSIIAGSDTGIGGDFVREFLTLPMFVLGVVLGFFILGYGVGEAREKTNSMIVRILSPLVGLVVGSVLFLGGAFLALIASLSNVREGD